jgi:hypothetical protein
MKLMCKNAIFSLRIHIIIGETTITGIATGTALCLRALPIPNPLKINRNTFLIHENQEDKRFFDNIEKLS